MEPIFSTDEDDSRQENCIQLMKEKFKEISDPEETEYTCVSTLSGGKSGAIIKIVKHKKSGKNVVLKIYKSKKYDPIDLEENTVSRPVREIYTTCVMSGTEGFPIVYDFGILTDKKDKNDYLYLISELVSGEPMSKLDMTTFSPEQSAAVLLQLLNLLYVAKDKLGLFIHNDLHPDNIFIDKRKCYEGKINFGKQIRIKFKTPCPKVSIIDFDLAVSKKYSSNPTTRYGLFLPFSVLQWIKKCFDTDDIAAVITKSSDAETEDLVIWNIYYIGLSMLQLKSKGYPITKDAVDKFIDEAKTCKTLEQCLAHPYINEHMNARRTQYRHGEPEFVPTAKSEERKQIEESINLISDTILRPLGIDEFVESFMESYRELNTVYNSLRGTEAPHENIQFFLTFYTVSTKDQTLEVDSCLTGKIGNINVSVTLPEKIVIQLVVKDKSVNINFNTGLRIKNVTHRGRIASVLESLIICPTFYLIYPIIYNVNIKSSDREPIGSTELTLNCSFRKIGTKDYKSVLPPNTDIDWTEQLNTIMSCVMPILFKNKDIFQQTVTFQTITREGDITILGNAVKKNLSDILQKISHMEVLLG